MPLNIHLNVTFLDISGLSPPFHRYDREAHVGKRCRVSETST